MPTKDGESTTLGDCHLAGFGCSVLLSSNVSHPVNVYEMIGIVFFGCHCLTVLGKQWLGVLRVIQSHGLPKTVKPWHPAECGKNTGGTGVPRKMVRLVGSDGVNWQPWGVKPVQFRDG
ncbi:hypothetical protein COB72_05325 [bacterium]|nr:MAG: hypothetical protein COB72_05325 [bacterium]